MRQGSGLPEPLYPSWRSNLVLATAIALIVVTFWAWRDGFQWGDALGGLVIWLAMLAVLAVLHRFRAR